jgi:hypothetical protein
MTTITDSENLLLDVVLTGGRGLDDLPPVEAFTVSENRQLVLHLHKMAARGEPINVEVAGISLLDNKRVDLYHHMIDVTGKGISGNFDWHHNRVVSGWERRRIKSRIDHVREIVDDDFMPTDMILHEIASIAEDGGGKRDPLAERILQRHKAQSSYTGGLLGPGLHRLHAITDATDGLQSGLYIIGAEPNVFKTATQSNIAIDTLESTPDFTVLNYDFDDSINTRLDRNVAILTWNAFPRKNDTEDEFRRDRIRAVSINSLRRQIDDERTREAKQTAIDKLVDWTRSGRLVLHDIAEVHRHTQVENEVRRLRRSGPVLVLIDALYNLDIGDHGTMRENTIARANLLKAISTKYDCPVIATAEVRKGTGRDANGRDADNPPHVDDLMESGKVAYNADLAIMVYPRDKHRYRTGWTGELLLDFQKNKLSAFKGRLACEAVKAAGVITHMSREGFPAEHNGGTRYESRRDFSTVR